jgi:REP element-mobilizing transposase RayT
MADRKAVFQEPGIVEKFKGKLYTQAEKHRCWIPIFCFLPDHLHVIAGGTADTSRSYKAMKGFKIATGIWFSHCMPDCKWQHDFYDHIIRDHEDWRAQARYVFKNPVRAGLVDDPFDYPFSGTQAQSWTDIFI